MAHDPTADGSPGSDDKTLSSEDSSKVSATSMFAAVPAPPPVAPPVPSAPLSAPPEASSAASPSLPPGMPIVHEVVFPPPGSEASEGSASILSALRSLAADEKVRAAELPPSAFAKNELPPAKSDSGPSFVQSPASAGFTQLLRALSEKSPAPPHTSTPSSSPPVQANPAPSQTPSSSAASFTRLLRALDDDRATPSTAGEVSAAPERIEPIAGQMSGPQAEAFPKSAQPEPETAAASVAALRPPPIPQTPAPEIKADPPAGSFTQLFQALDSEPSSPPAPVVARTPDAAVIRPSEPLRSPDPKSLDPQRPGTFTQIFQALDSRAVNQHPPVAEEAPAQPSEAPGAAGNFTQLFQAVAREAHANHISNPPVKPNETGTAPSSPATSGGFTQFFQVIDQAKASTATPASPPPVMPASPQEQSPGSFTQLFQSVGSGAPDVPPSIKPAQENPLPTASPKAPVAHSGASFTELFRAIDPAEIPEPPRPASSLPQSSMAAAPNAPEPHAAESFTQMFRAADSAAKPDTGGLPPQTWGQVPQPQTGLASPLTPTPFAAEPQHSDASNLTQLLRTLDPSGSRQEPPAPSPPLRPDAFTSLYGDRQPLTTPIERMQPTSLPPNLGQPPATNFAAPGRSPTPDPTPSASGSSDFTRIIQASSLREQALKQGERPVQAKPATAPPAPPPAQPQMPGFPLAAPQFPHPNVLPPLNLGHGGMAPPAQSFKPAVPNLNPAQWMPPEPQPSAPAPAPRAQPLLPLILIGIIFLLVVVLVAVIFLLKR